MSIFWKIFPREMHCWSSAVLWWTWWPSSAFSGGHSSGTLGGSWWPWYVSMDSDSRFKTYGTCNTPRATIGATQESWVFLYPMVKQRTSSILAMLVCPCYSTWSSIKSTGIIGVTSHSQQCLCNSLWWFHLGRITPSTWLRDLSLLITFSCLRMSTVT